jgi:predicted dienelactone hydrolase
MKIFYCRLVGILLITILVTPYISAKRMFEAESKLEGLWVGTIETVGFTGKMELKIVDESIKAQVFAKLSSAGQDFSVSIENIKINRDQIAFSTRLEIVEIKYRLNFIGKLFGNELQGTLSTVLDDTSNTSGTWLLKRQGTTYADDNSKLELPSPTGPYKVGRRHFNWIDKNRQEFMTDDPSDRRELVVEIWYPSEGIGQVTLSPYFSNLESLKDVFGDTLISQVNLMSSHSVDEAKLAGNQTKYSVLIFSPGSGMSVSLYSTLIEELASRGYVIVTIAHPYELLGVILSGNRNAITDEEKVKDYLAYVKERIYQRAADASFVLGKLAELNRNKESWLSNRLDLTRVGVFGHSRGGVAAAQACMADKRFKACLNMDGGTLGRPFYPDSSRGDPTQVLMWFQRFHDKPSDEQLASWKMNRQQSDQNLYRIQSRVNSLFQSLQSQSYRVTVSGATHQSFSDVPLLSPNLSLETLAARRRMIRIIKTYTLAFFDKYLKHKSGVLFDGSSGDYPEVVIEQFTPYRTKAGR